MAINATVQVSPSQTPVPSSGSSGPLKDLYSQPSQVTLRYPSNLGGNSQKSDMVMFTVLATLPAGYDEQKNSSIVTNNNGGASGVTSVGEETDLTYQPKRYRTGEVVALYMPDTIQFTYNSSYSTVSLKDALKEGVEGVASAVGGKAKTAAGAITSAVDSDAVKLAASAKGNAINPQNQLLFDGIDFRSYQMAFTFTPRNKAESDSVNSIIKVFRLHAAPIIQTGLSGMFFKVPDSFIVQFVNSTGLNTYVNRMKESVLTSVDVNYSPNGIWSTHSDGSPTQIVMTLQFKEIALVDQTAINNGF